MFGQTTSEAITPTDHDTEVARASSAALAPFLLGNGHGEDWRSAAH